MPNLAKPSYLAFEIADYPWKHGIDYQKQPEKYQVGKGEQGYWFANLTNQPLANTGVSKTRRLPKKVVKRSISFLWTTYSEMIL